MAIDAVKAIKTAEAEAEKIIFDARAKAKQMVADAEKAGEALCERTEREVAADVAAMIAKINKKTEVLLRDECDRAAEESKEANIIAAAQFRNAVKIVVWGIMEKCQ